MVKPTKTMIFKDYLPKYLLPFMQSQLTPTCERVDAVCDVYIGKRSLKTRCRAGHGGAVSQRTCVDWDKPIPKRAAWHTFLLDNETKQQLFEYISEEMRNSTSDKIYHLLSTKGDIVFSNKGCDLSSISPCSQEEGDTRLQLQYTVIRMLPIMDTLLLIFEP